MSTKIIGILGGIASGKTTAATVMGELGAEVVEADTIAHDVLCEPRVVAEVRESWGDEVMDVSGQVDRHKLGAIVFRSAPEIERLNSIVHPRVAGKVRSLIAEARRRDAPAVALDAALLLEAGLREACDLLVFIETSAPKRQQFATQKRGWSIDELMRRESHQMPLDQKRKFADCVVSNNGSPEALREQVLAFWEREIAR